MLNRMARKFVAGRDAKDAISLTQELNKKGISTAIDILTGPSRNKKQAQENTEQYLSLLEAIKEAGVDASISLKLTQLGLTINEYLCQKNLEIIANSAAALGNTVTIDMEEHRYKRDTIDVFKRLHSSHPNLFITIQAYLHSSLGEAHGLLDEGASIRLVKGVYREPSFLAFHKKDRINEAYARIAKEMIASGKLQMIATHDERMLDVLIAYAKRKKALEKTELQFLYGVKPWLPAEMAGKGYKVRVYLPYGPKWFGYVLRRLREASRY